MSEIPEVPEVELVPQWQPTPTEALIAIRRSFEYWGASASEHNGKMMTIEDFHANPDAAVAYARRSMLKRFL